VFELTYDIGAVCLIMHCLIGWQPLFSGTMWQFVTFIAAGLSHYFEGTKMMLLPLLAAVILQFVQWIVYGSYFLSFVILVLGAVGQGYIGHLYGFSDYSKFQTSGRYTVGYRDFTTKINGGKAKLDCSVFYPAVMQDERTKACDKGIFGVKYLTYGQDQINGFYIASGVYPGNGFNDKFRVKQTMKPLLSSKVPVHRNRRRETSLTELQPIIFSHGLTQHRMCFAS